VCQEKHSLAVEPGTRMAAVGADAPAVHDAVAVTVQEPWGALDFLVHTLIHILDGLLQRPVLDIQQQDFTQVVCSAVHSLIAACSACAPLLRRSPSPRVVTFTSSGDEHMLPLPRVRPRTERNPVQQRVLLAAPHRRGRPTERGADRLAGEPGCSPDGCVCCWASRPSSSKPTYAEGIGADEAIARVEDMVEARVHEYQELEDALDRLCTELNPAPTANSELPRYAHGTRSWMLGNLARSLETVRYREHSHCK